MVVSNVTRRNSCYLICALLLLVAQVALAAPGFVASSRVSGGGGVANVEINFNCKVEYLQHEPPGSSDRVRIYLNPTAICNGIAPSAAQSRGRYRPINADTAKLVDFEYDGASFSEPVLILSFSEPVSYSIEASSVAFRIVVRVTTAGLQSQQEPLTVKHRQVLRPEEPVPDFVINLASFQRIPTIADIPDLELRPQQRIFYSEADVDGSTWYRLRLGDFSTVDEARKALVPIKAIYPEAWIDQVDADGISVDLTIAANEVFAAQTRTVAAGEGSGDSRADALMGEARQEMIAGNTSRAVQIYTKVLRLPDNSRHAEAQEYLALAREKSGQVAHAKAEYQRYLSLYPDSEGAKRVGQRLAALLAIDKKPDTTPIAARGQPRARRDSRNE
ncbi:MAG: SPOR domain-containing protein, partial [Woeseiaceae bacterium]